MIIESLRKTLIDIARSRELAELPPPQYRTIDCGREEPPEYVRLPEPMEDDE